MSNIVNFILKLSQQDIKLYTEEGKLKINLPKGTMDDSLLQEIKERKAELIAYLSETSGELVNEIPRLTLAENYVTSSGQKRLWILGQFDRSSVAYNIPGTVFLNEKVDLESFKKAVFSTVDRHEILRTVFLEDTSGYSQRVAGEDIVDVKQTVLKTADLDFQIDFQNYSGFPDPFEKVQEYINEDANRQFDLEKGPLLRAALLQMGENECMFYYNMHHIISDGWSGEVLTKDVIAFYKAYVQQQEITPENTGLDELRIQYKDFSAWQQDQLKNGSYDEHKTYWLKSLSGSLPVLDLPTHQQRPGRKTFRGHNLSTYISKELSNGVRAFTGSNGGTLFMGLIASWNALLYRYTGQQDIIVGTPVSGREHPELENQIGFYLNTLALRNQIDLEDDFTQFFQKVKETTLNGYKYQAYPFDRLVEDLELKRDQSRSAVFDLMLTLQNVGENETTYDPLENGMTAEGMQEISDAGETVSKFDMSVTFQEIGEYIALNVIYNPDVYDQDLVSGLMQHYKQLLGALLENPQGNLSQLNYLRDEEKHEVEVQFNQTQTDFPEEQTITEAFEEQVAKNPNKVALVFESETYTYDQLNSIANQLAAYLKDQYDVQPDDLIGMKLERSEWMIIAMLGILKSGGAYVPIDKDYPADRIAFIEQDTNCKVCIDDEELKTFLDQKDQYGTANSKLASTAGNLAYVIYTSGSTGKPKGVMVEHQALMNYNNWFTQTGQITSSDSSLLLASIAFDGVKTCIYGCLLNGGTLHVLKKFATYTPSEIVDYICDKNISFLKGTPSYYKLLIGTDPKGKLVNSESLRLIITGGDTADLSYVKTIVQNSEIELMNHYGPTETTIGSAAFSVNKNNLEQFQQDLSIGKPVSNTQVYILDAFQNPVPKGVVGEICIAGDGLARGYLNRPEITSEKFVSNPFAAGGKMYKTGDAGRWLPDGNLQFLGRIDDQIKVNGYRIEPGEIEQVLTGMDAIQNACVVVKENAVSYKLNETGNNSDEVQVERQMVAYITAESQQDIATLRSSLKKKLPDYMVPAYFVQLPEMPLTPNGKIDKKSLPEPTEIAEKKETTAELPQSEVEQKIVEIWEMVLGIKNVGTKDDFFALGGSSFKVMGLVVEYRHAFHVELTMQDLYDRTELHQHAELIEIRKWMSEKVEKTNVEEELHTYEF